MSLISKQIDELRSYASTRKGELAKLINDAADTIEALSARQEGIVDAIKTADINGWVKDDLIGQIEALSAQTDGDVISRQAMFETVTEYEKQLREIYGDENELVETVKILKHRLLIELPSVQPESSQIARDIATIIENEQDMRVALQPEIIRCKDCKHWREGTTYTYCDKLFGMGVLDIYDYMTADDDYCSMAERKE